jgi:hypothetical protein
MNSTANIFNNREIALFLWLSIFLIWAFFKKDIRESFFKVLQAFCNKKLLLLNAIMLIYVVILIYLFYMLSFWNTSLIKNTALWFFGVAFIMLMNTNKANENDSYFKDVVIGNLKLVVVLEFILNLYVFNLTVEIILTPIIISIVLLDAIAETKAEYLIVKKFLGNLLALWGIFLFIFTTYKIFIDFHSLANLKNLRSFLLPPTLTFSYLPFIYFMALYMKYKNIFVRINISNNDKTIKKFAKRKILIYCHLNLRKLNHFSRIIGIMKFDKKEDILNAIQKFNIHQ